MSEARRRLVPALLLAQLLSLAIAATAVTSQALVLRGINAPTLQCLLNYLLLSATFGAALLRRRLRTGAGLCHPWWCYAALGLLDVEANALITKAYQFTSLTSVTLLDCTTIPAVMLLSVVVLRARYRSCHYLGAALCVAGLAVLVTTDRTSSTAGPAPLLGDALAVAGALLYAASNVAQESLLHGAPVPELLAMLGLFGALFSGLQVALLERDGVARLAQLRSPADWQPLLGFAAALFLFYCLVPTVLLWGGAAVLNVSLLTSDLWAALARVVLFGGFGGTGRAFAVAATLVAGGIQVFAVAGAAGTDPARGAECSRGGSGGEEGGDGFAPAPGHGGGWRAGRYLRLPSQDGGGDAQDLGEGAGVASGGAASPTAGAEAAAQPGRPAQTDVEAGR